MSDSNSDSMRDLAAGYALGALTPEETRDFESALAGSPELQREVREHRELNAVLALAEAETPPPELRARLMERIGEAKRASVPGRAVPAPAVAPARRSFTPVVMGAGLAAALVLTVGLTLEVRSLNQALRDRDSLLAVREQVLAEREATLNGILEPNVQLVTMVATGEAPPVAQVFFDRTRRSAIVHTFRLPPAGAGRAYQLWLLPRAGTPIASRVFNTEPDGHGLEQRIQIPADQEIAGFALTEEPAGGSPQPTSRPFLVGMLSGPK